MPTPPLTPAERFAAILLWLGRAVDTQSMWGKLARPLGLLIQSRIREIKQRFARLAARLAAGTYVPRRSTTRRRPAERKPRTPNPLPQDFAWLIKLVPETAAFGSQLRSLLANPEMAALLAAAPAPMRRPLRSLCRMLGVSPPPVLNRDHIKPIRQNPSPASNPSPARREREGPVAKRREGERVAARRAESRQPHSRLSPPPRACGPPKPA